MKRAECYIRKDFKKRAEWGFRDWLAGSDYNRMY